MSIATAPSLVPLRPGRTAPPSRRVVLPHDPSLAAAPVRREVRPGLVIGAGALVIVLFIAAFAGLMMRQIDEASRLRASEHVGQLHKAVTYQLDTMMVGIDQTLRHAEHEIRTTGDPQRLAVLSAERRVSLHLLRDLMFIDADGRVVVSTERPHDVASMSNRRDRDYFTGSLRDTRHGSRVGQPIRGRRTGLDLIPVSQAVRDDSGALMGVLVALIDIEALEHIWVEIGLTPQDRIALIGEGGRQLFSWPQGLEAGGEAGIVWSQTILDRPLQVVATLDPAMAERHGAKAKRTVMLAAAAGAAMIVLLCLLIANRQAANGAVKARLLATIEAIPIEYMEYDRDGRLILINQAARLSQGWTNAAMGKTQRELLAESLVEMRAQHPDQDWDSWMAKRLATSDRLGTFELTRPNGDAGRFFVQDMPGGGRVVLRVDITDAKQRETELEATQERYRRLFDTIPYPLVVVSRVGRRFLMANVAAVEQYGWSWDELKTMTSDDLYTADELPRLQAMRQAAGPVVARVIAGFHHRKKDGTLIDVEMQAQSMELNGTPAMLLMCADVTERLSLEGARTAAEEQLRQSQKMEAVGQLTGGIAHDFNNLLTVILANADALQEDGIDPAALPQRVQAIGAAVGRASDLTRQLLAFSRKQALDPKPTDLNELVESTGKMLRRALGEHIEINSVLAGGLWTVKVDRTQLETALVNLCVNARDAMPEGGKLVIQTANVSSKEMVRRGVADAVAAGDYAMLAVTDTGSGISKDTLARVFEPFFTTKEAGKGTGLGLSMVYGFIKQSNGHIQVDSEVGRGTTFRLYLPRTEAAVVSAAAAQPATLPGGTERILVVEDEPQVRSAVVAQLQKLGYQVSAAPDGRAGLAAVAATETPFDLVLTDVVMPGGMTGKALADEVARCSPETLTAFMSGYTDSHLADGVLLLKKPFRKRELAQFVRTALAGMEKRAA